MMQYCFGINTIILLSVSQLGTLFASDASFWCYININELYIKKRLLNVKKNIRCKMTQISSWQLRLYFVTVMLTLLPYKNI